MEDGTVTLIGATTENPSFELNAALLSRARVLLFRALDADALSLLLERAEDAAGEGLPLDEEARRSLVRMADGDGRAALTLAEEVLRAAKPGEVFTAEALQEVVQRRAPVYDKAQEGHYNLISALHKTIRGSDPDAALYYLARMLDAGEDRLFIARRLVRRRLGAVAHAPAVLLADHDPEVGGAPLRALEIGQGGGADQPVGFDLVDRETESPRRAGKDDGVEVAAGLDRIQRPLVVTQQPGDLLVGVPALERGPVFGHVGPQADYGRPPAPGGRRHRAPPPPARSSRPGLPRRRRHDAGATRTDCATRPCIPSIGIAPERGDPPAPYNRRWARSAATASAGRARTRATAISTAQARPCRRHSCAGYDHR